MKTELAQTIAWEFAIPTLSIAAMTVLFFAGITISSFFKSKLERDHTEKLFEQHQKQDTKIFDNDGKYRTVPFQRTQKIASEPQPKAVACHMGTQTDPLEHSRKGLTQSTQQSSSSSK